MKTMSRFGREVRDIAHGRTPTHQHLRERLVTLTLVTLVVDLIGTLVVFAFEHNASGTEITNIGDSIFWTTAQLLTVSSQMKNPLTTGGRVVDLILEGYAIAIVATLAGSFGTFFYRRSEQRHPIERERPGKSTTQSST